MSFLGEFVIFCFDCTSASPTLNTQFQFMWYILVSSFLRPKLGPPRGMQVQTRTVFTFARTNVVLVCSIGPFGNGPHSLKPFTFLEGGLPIIQLGCRMLWPIYREFTCVPAVWERLVGPPDKHYFLVPWFVHLGSFSYGDSSGCHCLSFWKRVWYSLG